MTAVWDEYVARRDRHRREAADLARRDSQIANGRLCVVLAAGLMAWLAYGRGWFSPWALVLPGLGLVALVVRHGRVHEQLDRAKRRVAFYEAGLRRLDGTWAGTGTSGVRFADPAHPYAEDLDLFGRGSLFELLCTARTSGGEACLAAWLRGPADTATIRARQEAVRELVPRLDLREDLALLGEGTRAAIDPAALVAWGAQPPLLADRRARLAARMLAVGTLLAGAAWGLGWCGYGLLLGFVLLGRVLDRQLGARVKRVVTAVDRPARDLGLLASLLARLEAEPVQSPRLQALQAALRADGPAPSARIERLQTLVGSLAARGNPLLALLLALLLWTTQYAFAIEGWRGENGRHLGQWLAAVGEFEALCALAGYAYEHPEDVFPEIDGVGAGFEAAGLSHPLLPSDKAVANDIRLDGTRRLYIVSGSNMSGKSTLLRALGVNAVLALAGAPVRARSLRLTPLSLGASLRTLDSLHGGISRFYAEITRLRQVVDIGRDHPPLLFLLDEILHGTNSHDRRIGAEAVVRALLRSGGIGLITTHDLALAALADDPALAAANVHLEDQLVDGEMRFDYHLRPGVVEKSNAIALMRAVGLEV